MKTALLIALVLVTLVYPATINVVGNSAGVSGGNFPDGMLYYLGTNDSPGKITATFQPCHNLVVQTGKFWPLADKAQFRFYRHGWQIGMVTVQLFGNSEAAVSFPRTFDRVTLTNITRDPPAVDDAATMTILGIYCHK